MLSWKVYHANAYGNGKKSLPWHDQHDDSCCEQQESYTVFQYKQQNEKSRMIAPGSVPDSFRCYKKITW